MRAAFLAAVLALAPAAARAGDESVHSDDWYAVYVGGRKAGHAHTVVLHREPGPLASAGAGESWVTTTDTYLELARRGRAVALEVSSRIEEDASGVVTAFRQSQRLSDAPVVVTGRLQEGVFRIDQNGVAAEVPYPEGALGPAATDRAIAATGFAEGARTAVRGFEIGQPGTAAEQTFTVTGTEAVQVIDRRLVLHVLSVTNTASASRSLRMWLDGNARMHVSESDVPGVGVLRMVRTTEALARAATSPAEIFTASLIEPDRGIASPRRAKRLVLRLSRTDGTPFDAALCEGEGQSLGPRREDGARDVTITVPPPPRGEDVLRRPVEDEELRRYLVPTAYLESGDRDVQALARRAVGEERDALLCARRIEALVRLHVADKSLDVGFATAAETARSREGDCTEHAVLAAALARAAGLPARVVTGIVYVPGLSGEGIGPRGAFGYHMWTEVLVAKGHWQPIDAALGGFDATHVAMAKSDLSMTSPPARMTLSLLEAIASLRIRVLDVETAQETE